MGQSTCRDAAGSVCVKHPSSGFLCEISEELPNLKPAEHFPQAGNIFDFSFFCLPVATFDCDTFQNDLKDGICHCHSATHTVKNDVTVLYSFSLWALYHL